MSMSSTVPLLEVRKLQKFFPIKTGLFGKVTGNVHAVDGVSFSIRKGETLALVGESGCGKSTVGRSILRLFDLTSGEVLLDGVRIDSLSASALRPLRKRIQVIFQDPFSSLNPRMRVHDIIAEPIRNFGLCQSEQEIEERVVKLLEKVRLPKDAGSRWPHEFSGGQRQRICIARALAAEPELIICDEAVSALDVSVKAQIVNLLQDLQKELGLALLFISHDLAIVEHMTHRVAVMYLGKIVELADRKELFLRRSIHTLLRCYPRCQCPIHKRRQIVSFCRVMCRVQLSGPADVISIPAVLMRSSDARLRNRSRPY